MKLTDIVLRSLRPPECGQKFYPDDALAGFGIRLSQGGAKTFVLMCGEDRQRMTIGRYPIITLSDARTEAKRILAERTLGRRRHASTPFDEAKAAFLKASREKNRPRTVSSYQRLLDRHFPFGRRKLGDIERQDIRRYLDRITAPSERDHALVALKVMMTWSMRSGHVEHSPCDAYFAPQRRSSRERVLTPAELKTVAEAAKTTPSQFGRIVELCILTGQRRGEIGQLRWDWFDEADHTITIPSTVTKNRRTHVLPYGDLVATVLSRIERDGEFLFPARCEHVRGKPTAYFNGWSVAKEQFDKTLEDVEPWQLHDLRRTFRTLHAQIGTPPHIAERLINHVSFQSTVEKIYDRYRYLDEMRQAVANYETHLTKLVT